MTGTTRRRAQYTAEKRRNVYDRVQDRMGGSVGAGGSSGSYGRGGSFSGGGSFNSSGSFGSTPRTAVQSYQANQSYQPPQSYQANRPYQPPQSTQSYPAYPARQSGGNPRTVGTAAAPAVPQEQRQAAYSPPAEAKRQKEAVMEAMRNTIESGRQVRRPYGSTQISDDLRTGRRSIESLTPQERTQISHDLTAGIPTAADWQKEAVAEGMKAVGQRVIDLTENVGNLGENAISYLGNEELSSVIELLGYPVKVAGSVVRAATEADLKLNISSTRSQLHYWEEQMKRAGSGEYQGYVAWKIRCLSKQLSHYEDSLEEMRRSRIIDTVIDAESDYLENAGNNSSEKAVSLVSESAQFYTEKTIRSLPSILEYKAPWQLGVSLSVGRGIRESRQKGENLIQQGFAGAKSGISAGE